MKKLIKVTIIAFLALFIQPINAQTFGLKAGFNMATLFEQDLQYTYSNNYSFIPGFHAGITLDLHFNEIFSFEPGLLFTTNGTKYEANVSGTVLSGKLNLYYIKAPLNFKLGFKLDRRGKNKVIFTSGPYIAYGVSGKLKTTVDSNSKSESASGDVKWGNNEKEDNFKPFDYGWSIGAGFEFAAISLTSSYDYGLANISAIQENGLVAQNRVLKFSIGYLFIGNSRGGYGGGYSKGHKRRRR